ncbi:MAG: penicillin-binding protein activator [Pasteurellaceae bacterium]|nr:penicillin-binding protein activator [Pasteurellaceae bacterium]
MPTILVQTRPLSQKMKRALVPSALAFLLSACSGSGLFTNEVTESLKMAAYASSEFYINKAEQTTKETQQSYRLLAIRKLIEEKKVVEAQNTMANLRLPELNAIQQVEFQLLSAQLATLQKNYPQANHLLQQVLYKPLSTNQLIRLYQTEAQIAENSHNVIESIRARIRLDRLLTDNLSRQDNNNKIWENLRNANQGMLSSTTVNTGETDLAGWLALVLTYNHYLINPSELPNAIVQWKRQYPSHSAAHLLPTELQNIANFQQTQLNRVALLLPFSGNAKVLGDMIKKGFDDAKGDAPTSVQLYDTASAPIADLISQAKLQGAQTIIGPLLKFRVDELAQTADFRDVNVLALNTTQNTKAIAQLCYYGLSPEAEARSGAERLVRDGIQYAIVFAPQDDFGQRSADAFVQRWRQLTNRDADVRYYHQVADSLSSLSQTGIPQGSGLYLLGTTPAQVIELKQGLDNSALSEQFPIYTSSRTNSPNNGADFRFTMEGVKFSEIPLLAQPQSDLYKKIEKVAESDFSMMRIYAMGSDAWSIASKFNEFRQIPGYKISGLTGILSAGPNCNIEREMTWLQYQNGAIIPAN